jgi:hypothetical protein
LKWPVLYRGYFINLDGNTRRLTAITDHLNAIGLGHAYQRIAAVDGRAAAPQHPTKLDPGNLGLWLTQENILAAGAGSDAHLHILEDDAILARSAAGTLPALLSYADDKMPDWDLIFTHTYVPLDLGLFLSMLKYWELFKKTGRISLVDLKNLYPAHTTSLLVNQRSIEKYHRLIAGKWSLGLPIDMYLRALIRKGELKAWTCVPFLSSTSEEGNRSDIRGPVDVSRRVFAIYSQALFTDSDHARLNEELCLLSKDAVLSSLSEIYLRALAFTQTDQFKPF